MTDYLADVVMPPEPQSPTSSPITEPPSPTDRIMEDQMSLTDQPHMDGESQIEIEDQSEEEEQLIPEPEKRKKIPQEEIFSAPKVKTILDPTPQEVPQTKTEKKPKQTRKKRGPASQEQLERLARGREKAKETRARKKKEKEEKVAKEKSDKELVEAVRERERKKLRKKLETPIEDELPHAQSEVKIVEKPVVVEKGYSQQDLDDAVARAVEQSVQKVEILRKKRKEVKKQAEAKAKHDAKVFHEINKAMKNDVWANCFV